MAISNPNAGSHDRHRDSQLQELQQALLGTKLFLWFTRSKLMMGITLCTLVGILLLWGPVPKASKPRLPRGVGTGQTTMRHAQAVGAIFGDDIFNQPLVWQAAGLSRA